MKIFLFMYPLEGYFQQMLKDYPALVDPVKRLNEIIELRYRSKNYRIYWIMPSDPNIPDITDGKISSLVQIKKMDNVVSSGVSLEKVSGFDPNFIYDQLPKPIEEVKIGGFHQFDCVDKIGQFLYCKRIPTLVDEDTTEFFFRTMSRSTIPDFREFTLEGFNILVENPQQVSNLLDRRIDSPWFVQPGN